MVQLRAVDRENWRDCAKLELHPAQEGFLAPNVYTIAQSKFETIHRPRAIYEGDTLVGMLCFCHEDEPEDDLELYWLFRFMIDKRYQNRGLGIAALEALLEEVRTLGGKRLRTMHHPKNDGAARVYQKFGFTKIGTLDDGDILYEMEV